MTPISNNEKLGVVVHAYHPSCSGNINSRIVAQADLGINGKILI
jgi:hypothetical protein